MTKKMNFSDMDMFRRGDTDSGSEGRSLSPEVLYQGSSLALSLHSVTGVNASQGDSDNLQTAVRRENGGSEGICRFVTCLKPRPKLWL